MITIRPSNARALSRQEGLEARHSFSHAQELDARWHHFRVLRNVREVVMEAGVASELHAHRELEVLTWVQSGLLGHEDGLGGIEHLGPGAIEVMSAGIGLEHRERNIGADPLHLLQFAVFPRQLGGAGRCVTGLPSAAGRRNRFQVLASPSGADGSLAWQAEAWVHVADLEPGCELPVILPEGRAGWLHVLEGRIEAEGEHLIAGDGAALEDQPRTVLVATQPSRVFLVELA